MKIKTTMSGLLFMGMLSIGTVPAYATNLLLNGDFSQGGLRYWAQGGGCCTNQILQAGNALVEFVVGASTYAEIDQNIETLLDPTEQYFLEFDYAGSATQFAVRYGSYGSVVNDLFIFSGSTDPASGFLHASLDVKAIAGQIYGNSGVAFYVIGDSDLQLDNVSFANAIPEPSSLVLLGLALGCMVIFRRKRSDFRLDLISSSSVNR